MYEITAIEIMFRRDRYPSIYTLNGASGIIKCISLINLTMMDIKRWKFNH